MLRPDRIRTDGSNAFARYTMEVRIPQTLQETIDRNPDYPPSIRDALARLRDEVLADAPIRLIAPPAPDYDLWQERFAPHAGERWLDADWFFCEAYLFRLVAEATRFWDSFRDPFAPFKAEEMTSAALWTVLGAILEETGDAETLLEARLRHTLWGNRIDLNLKTSAERGTAATAEHLLADDLSAAARHLLAGEPGDVHLIMDNAGTEQACDYALVDTLLSGIARTVTLHVKMYPLFVSDVLVPDVYTLLGLMEARGGAPRALAERLEGHLATGRLRVVPDLFWNTDGVLWELPPRLHLPFRDARLVILKGDANYRRATNDALWPPNTPLAEAITGFPAPLLALRTLKSDTLVGVDEPKLRALEGKEGWRVGGEYGVAQMAMGDGLWGVGCG